MLQLVMADISPPGGRAWRCPSSRRQRHRHVHRAADDAPTCRRVLTVEEVILTGSDEAPGGEEEAPGGSLTSDK